MNYKIWIFGFTDVLDKDQAQILSDRVRKYLAGWNAHGALIESSFELVRNQFLYVLVSEDSEKPSGCSLDAFHGAISDIAESLSLNLFDENDIVYQDSNRFVSCSRSEFKVRAREKTVSLDTLVADFSVRSLKENEVPSGMFLKPASKSWHGKVFFDLN